ncbi:nucleotidyltransferase [Virgibacillus sp. W0430]|uniref:nucleotidyltransferase n=1 Tax=Virgibacillus sp. W0430 TaxID=3391580 RepID=UPI003F452EA8
MKSCGLIVEYNPFHNGHLYHVQTAKEQTKADCIIAVMSGSFLQRGEPAIIDKFHRARAALTCGVDVVIELPYAYAVQSSELFAKGAVQLLHELRIDCLCFGSEQGHIHSFKSAYHQLKRNLAIFHTEQRKYLDKGWSFPEASKKGYEIIGLADSKIDLTQPNNILGFSYVKEVMELNLPIELHTIKRTGSNYHDHTINNEIASATSIRRSLFSTNSLSPQVQHTLPHDSQQQLLKYRDLTTTWHSWELYFPYLQYRVMTTPVEELAQIHGMVEGLEYRIKKTAREVSSFQEWMERVKTKRYTWTRIQRTFTHLLTNTKKSEITTIMDIPSIPYVRLLGMTKTGQAFLRTKKKQIEIPVLSGLKKEVHPILSLEERASHAYYSILPSQIKNQMFTQELKHPIII